MRSGLRSARRLHNDTARKNLRRHFSAKPNATRVPVRRNIRRTDRTARSCRKRTDCRIELPRPSLLHCKGPPSATPTSIGSSAGVLQRQLPLSVFWKANVFSIRSLCATEKLSLLSCNGVAFPDRRSQHRPVQADAIGLQTANGDSTIISTSAVTRASCADTSVSIWNTRLTKRKSSQALAEWICATHKSTASASGTGEN